MGDLMEIVVFLSYENEDPKALGEALVDALDIEPIAAGVDTLTGAVTLRFYYESRRAETIRAWLTAQEAAFELTYH
jgi:hypothetical protein